MPSLAATHFLLWRLYLTSSSIRCLSCANAGLKIATSFLLVAGFLSLPLISIERRNDPITSSVAAETSPRRRLPTLLTLAAETIPEVCGAGAFNASAFRDLKGIMSRESAFLRLRPIVQQSEEGKVKFGDILRSFLNLSREEGTVLLTLQIGAMDGTSNDPLWSAYQNFGSLRNWLPMAVEPVRANFVKLAGHYGRLIDERQLPCPILSDRAITDQPTRNDTFAEPSRCEFCHFNTSENAPDLCKSRPDWIKLQLGSLQCDERKKFSSPQVWEMCVVKEKIECETMPEMLRRWRLAFSDVTVLQIDVEGYESSLLRNLLSTTPFTSYPPVIHFEHKVLKYRDQRDGTKSAEELFVYLQKRGYVLHDQGEDMLALLQSFEEMGRKTTRQNEINRSVSAA